MLYCVTILPYHCLLSVGDKDKCLGFLINFMIGILSPIYGTVDTGSIICSCCLYIQIYE